MLDQNAIPQPTFDGQTEKSLTRQSNIETTVIQGQCDPRIRAIRVALDGYGAVAGDLARVSVGAPTVTCASNGSFSFTLESLADLVGIATPNQTYRLNLRADTAGGISNPSTLSILYVRDEWEQWRLTTGATESAAAGPRLATTGGTFKADVRVVGQAGADDTGADALHDVARSSNFVFKRGRAAR